LSYLLDETRLQGLNRDPDPFGSAIGHADAHPLEIGPELALGDARHVGADTAALLGLALAVDDVPLDGATTCDEADFGHSEMS